MIIANYSDEWKGERLFPEKSSFTIKGYDLECKKWNLPSIDTTYYGKKLFTLYMFEPSPEHPAVMGRMEVYEHGYAETLNPWWDNNDFIYNELKESAEKHLHDNGEK